jgi:septum site-determining protein MinC
MDAAITIKGTRDGLLMTLEAGELPEILAQIASVVASRSTFFQGGKVALQVGDRRLTPSQVNRLCKVLEQNQIEVWAVLSTDLETRAAAEALGLETALPSMAPALQIEPQSALMVDASLLAGTGLLVHRTLRSGQTVYHAGHVVIIGDVNPGAEVVAGGDVVVWGSLRGTVHAGAEGDEGRCVCALDLSPTQLRIGKHIARPPEDRRRRRSAQPERAFVSEGQLVAERWR